MKYSTTLILVKGKRLSAGESSKAFTFARKYPRNEIEISRIACDVQRPNIGIGSRFRLQSVAIKSEPIEMESATGQTSSSGQLTEVINSWLISVSVYQGILIVGHATLLTKTMLSNVVCQPMSTKAKREWLSFQCTNKLGIKTNLFSRYL